MTKRLSPERLAEHYAALNRATQDHDSDDAVRRELLGHIQAVEAELVHPVNRVVALEKELAEARAEIAQRDARIAEHLIMFQSNDETIAKLREIIVDNTKLTDELRAENARLKSENEHALSQGDLRRMQRENR